MVITKSLVKALAKADMEVHVICSFYKTRKFCAFQSMTTSHPRTERYFPNYASLRFYRAVSPQSNCFNILNLATC
jgi:hypothetical protein